MIGALCPYCHQPSKIVGGDAIYPNRRDLALLKYHRCAPCDAHVGCHKVGAYLWDNGKKIVSDGTLPMGRLANAELRQAKMAAHAAFDPIWRDEGTPRRIAYDWLSKQLGIPINRTHIGEFDLAMCQRVVEVCKKRETV